MKFPTNNWDEEQPKTGNEIRVDIGCYEALVYHVVPKTISFAHLEACKFLYVIFFNQFYFPKILNFILNLSISTF